MLDLPILRAAIVSGLHTYLGLKVIVAEQAAKRPAYPYVTVNISSPLIPEGLNKSVESANVPSSGPDFEYDVEYTATEHVTLAMSISTYSKNFDECHEIAAKAHSWFSFVGYEHLKSNGMVVANIGNIGERDSLIIADYERRNGFDVTLRAVHQMKRTVETIESINITEE
jgi:hypothetical protein